MTHQWMSRGRDWRWEITALRRSATWQWPLWLEGKQLNGSKHSHSHTHIHTYTHILLFHLFMVWLCRVLQKDRPLPLACGFLTLSVTVNLWQWGSASGAKSMKCVSGEGEHFNTREERWAKKLTAGGHWVRQVEEGEKMGHPHFLCDVLDHKKYWVLECISPLKY